MRLPLTLVFALQCLLVIGAFVAVLLVLTEQQRSEFRAGLTTRLGLQQRNAMAAAASPLQQRVAQCTTALYDFRASLAANPHWLPANAGTASMGDFGEFYRRLFPVVATDPLVSNIVLMINNNESNPFWDGFDLHLSGIGRYHDNRTWTCVSRGVAVNFSTCPFGHEITPDVDFKLLLQIRRLIANRQLFLAPAIIRVFGYGTFFFYPLAFPVRWLDPLTQTTPNAVVIFTLSVPFMQSVVAAAVVSEASVAGLHVYAFGACSLMASRGVSPDFSVTATGLQFWPCGQTPDAALNQFWAQADAACAPVAGSSTDSGCADPIVADFSNGGRPFVGTAQRLRTAEALDLLLLQHTPREHFYGPSEAARLKGILIGAFAALGVVMACVAILLAIWLPVRALQANMDLAALMRNDEVRALKPVLLEVAALTRAFDAMNTKLLLARPFLPQSLLVADTTTDEDPGVVEKADDDDEGEVASASMETSDMSVHSEGGSLRSPGHSTSMVHSSNVGPGSASFAAQSTRRRFRSSTRAKAHISDNNSALSASDRAASGQGSAPRTDLAARGAQLVLKRVAVLVINVRGFHAAQRVNVADTLARLQRGVAELVEQQTALQRGIVDHFHGDHFVCAFNAARGCAQPAPCAAQAAVGTEAALRASPALADAFPGGLSMGLGCGRALVGNMGTATMQRLVMVGEAYGEAAALQLCMARLVLPQVPANALAGRCLALGRTVAEVEHRADFQILGTVAASHLLSGMPSAARFDLSESTPDSPSTAAKDNAARVAALNLPFCSALQPDHAPRCPRPVVACITAVRQAGGADEWLYELKEAQGAGLGPLNAALCALILRGEAPAANITRVTTPNGVSNGVWSGVLISNSSAQAPPTRSSQATPLAAAPAQLPVHPVAAVAVTWAAYLDTLSEKGPANLPDRLWYRDL